jgi:hypothetical protein
MPGVTEHRFLIFPPAFRNGLRTEPGLFYAARPSLAFDFLVALIQSLLKFLSQLEQFFRSFSRDASAAISCQLGLLFPNAGVDIRSLPLASGRYVPEILRHFVKVTFGT